MTSSALFAPRLHPGQSMLNATDRLSLGPRSMTVRTGMAQYCMRDNGPPEVDGSSARLAVKWDEERPEVPVLRSVDQQDGGLVGDGLDRKVADKRRVVTGRDRRVVRGVGMDRSGVGARIELIGAPSTGTDAA